MNRFLVCMALAASLQYSDVGVATEEMSPPASSFEMAELIRSAFDSSRQLLLLRSHAPRITEYALYADSNNADPQKFGDTNYDIEFDILKQFGNPSAEKTKPVAHVVFHIIDSKIQSRRNFCIGKDSLILVGLAEGEKDITRSDPPLVVSKPSAEELLGIKFDDLRGSSEWSASKITQTISIGTPIEASIAINTIRWSDQWNESLWEKALSNPNLKMNQDWAFLLDLGICLRAESKLNDTLWKASLKKFPQKLSVFKAPISKYLNWPKKEYRTAILEIQTYLEDSRLLPSVSEIFRSEVGASTILTGSKETGGACDEIEVIENGRTPGAR